MAARLDSLDSRIGHDTNEVHQERGELTMRVTIEHREEASGVTGKKRDYFVDCGIEFSEEEQAIIKARSLHDTVITSGYTSPPVSFARGESPYWLKGLAPLMIIGGFIFGVAGGGTLAGLIVIAGIGFLIYGFVAPHLHAKQSREQNITIRDIVNRRSFSLYAMNPVDAKIIDDKLRESLANLKSFLTGSAEIAAKQTFEL